MTDTKEPIASGFWVRGGARAIDDTFVSSCLAGLALLLRYEGLPPRATSPAVILFGIAYYTLTVGAWGQTFGKMAAGIKIIRRDGVPVGYGRAFARFFAFYLSVATANIGLVMAAFTKRKRSLHDYAAGTRVVYVPGVGTPRKALMVVLCLLYLLALTAAGVFMVRHWRQLAQLQAAAIRPPSP
jgi:uncharacterized RDD family membrane protein YckC